MMSNDRPRCLAMRLWPAGMGCESGIGENMDHRELLNNFYLFTDATAKREFAQVVAGWAEQSENGVLQVASKAVAQLKRS